MFQEFRDPIFPINNAGDAALASLFAVLIVFGALLLIIFVSWLFSKGINTVNAKTNILPREENKIIETDEDAAVAALVATIEFHNEFKKDARLVKIEQIDD